MLNSNFDKSFKRAQRNMFAVAFIALVLNVLPIVFVGWVIVKVLQHLGII